MPDTEYNLDDIKLKTVDQITEGEAEFLNANLDKLTDEDKEAYASVLTQTETPPAGDTPGETPDNPPADPGSDPGHAGNNGAQPAAGTPVFKTEAEARDYVTRIINEQKQKEIAAKTPDEEKLVPDDYKPKSWGEVLAKAAEIAEAKREAKEAAKETKLSEIRERLDREYQDITVKYKLPAADSEDGKVIHRQITNLGIKYNLPTYEAAHELWSQIPKEKGGGLTMSTPATPAVDKLKAQKSRAASLSRGQGEGGKSEGSKRAYQDLHKTSLDNLLDKALS